jgi:flagellum-specific peptidoglycan hydrolase FlgJ
MNNANFNLAALIWENILLKILRFFGNQWVQVSALLILLYMAGTDKVNFNFSKIKTQSADIFQNGVLYGTPFGTNRTIALASEKKEALGSKIETNNLNTDPAPTINEMINPVSCLNLANEATAVSSALSKAEQEQAAGLSNLSVVFNNANYFEKNNISMAVVAAKQMTCKIYIEKYAATAQEEAKIYNIPASITLAQGLLESNAGDSKLAKKENNHFGIKCKAKCQGCRCANYTDDDKYDMFRIFDSAWHSFREHSKLLSSGRYKYLTKLDRKDYKNWARGLKSAGYATDKKYAEKLITIIEYFKLDRFDK